MNPTPETKVLTEQETIDDLLARSKDDHASRMIVGSEVRWLISRIDALRVRAEQAEREVVYWKGLVHDEETRRAMAGPLACNHEQARHRADHAIRIYEAEFAKPHAQLQAVAQYRTAALARAGEVKP